LRKSQFFPLFFWIKFVFLSIRSQINRNFVCSPHSSLLQRCGLLLL
jgi:hypothetical protein